MAINIIIILSFISAIVHGNWQCFCFSSAAIVIDFEKSSYTIPEGESSTVCVEIKEPKYFLKRVVSYIQSYDGNASEIATKITLQDNTWICYFSLQPLIIMTTWKLKDSLSFQPLITIWWWAASKWKQLIITKPTLQGISC